MTAHPKIGSFPLTLSSNESLVIRHSCLMGGRGGLQNLVRQLTERNYFRDILGARSWDGIRRLGMDYLPLPCSFVIQCLTYCAQWSSDMPPLWHRPKKRTASRSTNMSSSR